MNFMMISVLRCVISIDLPSACTQQPPWDSCHDLTSYTTQSSPHWYLMVMSCLSLMGNGRSAIKKMGYPWVPCVQINRDKPLHGIDLWLMMLSPYTISTLEGHRRQLLHAMKPSAATYWHIIYYQYVMKFSNIIMQWGSMVNWQTNMIQLLIVLLTLCKFMYCQT